MLFALWSLVCFGTLSLALPVDQLDRRATVSPDATCGGTKGYTCLGSSFGNCCSTNGWWYASILQTNNALLLTQYQWLNLRLLRHWLSTCLWDLRIWYNDYDLDIQDHLSNIYTHRGHSW